MIKNDAFTLDDLKKYKRIYIIGPVGSGKTTLARKLSNILNLPHTETDVIRWNPLNNLHRTDTDRTKYLSRVLKSKKWIIDGVNCTKWTEPIWEKADIVIITDIFLIKRIFWVIKRYFLCEEEKQKNAPIGYLWKNIVWTIGFRKKH